MLKHFSLIRYYNCWHRYIGAAVWKSQGDIRDVISIGKLVRKSDGPLEIEQIMNTMANYDNMMMQQDVVTCRDFIEVG
jgi:hypothetical protein